MLHYKIFPESPALKSYSVEKQQQSAFIFSCIFSNAFASFLTSDTTTHLFGPVVKVSFSWKEDFYKIKHISMRKAAWVVVFVFFTALKFQRPWKKQDVEMKEWIKTFNFIPTGNVPFKCCWTGLWSSCPASRLAARFQGRSAPFSPE